MAEGGDGKAESVSGKVLDVTSWKGMEGQGLVVQWSTGDVNVYRWCATQQDVTVVAANKHATPHAEVVVLADEDCRRALLLADARRPAGP